MATNVGSIFITVSANTAGVLTGLSSAERALERFGSRLFFMGNRMTAGITVPLGLLTRSVLTFGKEFDKNMTEALAIMDNVSVEMRDKLERRAVELSKVSKYSAAEISEAYYDLASAGMEAVDVHRAIPIVVGYAQAGLIDMGKAAEHLTAIYNAFGPELLGVKNEMQGLMKVSDQLNMVNKLAIGTVTDFANALTSRAAQSASIARKSLEETLGTLAGFFERGIVSGPRAGQQFWMMMRDIDRTARVAAPEWEKLGASVYDVEGKMRPIPIILQQLWMALEGYNKEQIKQFVLTGKMGDLTKKTSDLERQSIMSLLKFQDRSKAATQTVIAAAPSVWQHYTDLMEKSFGKTAEIAGKQLESVEAQWNILVHKLQSVKWDAFKALWPVIRDDVIPVIEMLIVKLESLVKWFRTLEPETRRMIVLGGLLTMALGPFVSMLGSWILLLATMVGTLVTVGKLLKGVVGTFAFLGSGTAQKALAALAPKAASAAESALTGSGGLAAAILAEEAGGEVAAASGLSRLSGSMGTMLAVGTKLLLIVQAVYTAFRLLGPAVSYVVSSMDTFWNFVKGVLPPLALLEVILKRIGISIPDIAKALGTLVKEGFKGFSQAIDDVLTLGSGVVTRTVKLFEKLGVSFTIQSEMLVEGVKRMWDWFKNPAPRINFLESIGLGGLGTTLGKQLEKELKIWEVSWTMFWVRIAAGAEGFARWFSSLLDTKLGRSVSEFLSQTTNAIWEWFKTINLGGGMTVGFLIDVVSEGWDRIVKYIWSTLPSIQKYWKAVADNAGTVMQLVLSTLPGQSWRLSEFIREWAAAERKLTQVEGPPIPEPEKESPQSWWAKEWKKMWDEYGKNIEESRKKFQGYQGGLGGADMSGYTKTAAAASAMASSLQESWSQIVGDGGKKAKEMNTIWQMHAQEILNNEDVARRFYERYKDVIESVEDLNPALRKAIQNWWDLDRAEEAAYVRGAVSDQAAKMSEFMTAQDDKSFEKSVTNLEKYQDMVDDVTAQSKDRWRELQSFRWEEEGKTLRGLRSGWEKLAVDYAQQLRKMEQSRKDMTPDQSKELDQRIADYRVATQRMLDITRRMDLERAASALGVNKLIINSMDAMSEAVITRIVAIAESAYMVKLRLSELSKGFRTLGEAFDTKGWISGIADLLDWLVKAIDIANQMKIAMTAIREAFRTRIDIQWQNIGGMMVPLIDIQKINWTQLASGMISLFQAVAQGILLLDQILQSTSNWKRILGAAMVGGQIGAAIGSIWGPVGEAIGKIGGTAVGALIGWFKKPEYQRIMEEIGNSWGVAISEGTAKKIEETMKSRFGHMKNNRFYAEVLHLGDIIADAGGITEKNAKMFSDRMLWSFDHMASGIFTVTEGLQVFTDGLKEFAKYADAAGIDLAKLMRPQIDRFEQMVRSGFISVKEARGWYDENFSLFAENLEKTGSIASNEMIRLIRLNGELGLQSKAVADYIEVQMTRANEAWATLVDTIMAGVPETGLQGEDLSNTLDQLNRMGVLILATFNAAVAAGTPWLTALAGIGGSLDKLIEGYQRLNGSIDDAALNQLIWYRNFMKANEALFSGIEALNAGSIALANMGGVTAEVFQALQDQGLSMYADLLAAAEAAGGGQVDALRPIIPWLQTLQQMAREYGFELDETTQALIDLAMEHGLLKDEPVTVLGVLRDGFDRLIERLDLLLTRVYGLGGAIANLPSNKTITIDLDVPEVPDFTNPKPPTYTPEPMASGGVVRRPTVILAGEAGPEAIVPLDEARVGGVTVNFYLSTPDAATLKDFVSREVTPRLIDTLRRNEQGTLTSIRNVLGVT